MQSIVKAVRMRVSADKNRYLDGNFDLDLTYISDRIIAMSFPADGMESTYRNSIHEVSAMLNYRHFGHFMVFNLSERTYDYSILNNMVLDWCGFPDHHAPPLALLCKIVRTIHAWLEADAANVVVVHCLAGKGRTGTVIASYLIYSGLFNSAQDAMNFFALRRSLNSWGITGPSQKRYIQYFSDVIQKRVIPRSNPVMLKMIIMHTIPEFAIAPMRPGICPVLQIFNIAPEGGPGRMLYSSQEGHEGEELRSFPASDRSLAFHVNRVVRGDILVLFHHVNAFYRMEQMLRLNIHTGMFHMPRLRLTKTELDGAEGDKRFDYNFFLDLVFEDLDGDMGVANHAMWDAAIDMEQQLLIWKQDLCAGTICFTPEASITTAEKIQKARALASNRGFVVGKSGWLTKKGHQVKNWKRRWFVLKDATLSYYKSPKQTTPAGVIPVTDILRVVSDPELSKREDMPLCFELITCKPGNTGRIVTYIISAPNDADREDWIQCIETSMSSSYEIGRLFVDIIEVDFKYGGTALTNESVYVSLMFGRQRFQSTSVPSIPGRWDQTGEFILFEEPNEMVVGVYLQSDDALLGSTTIDSTVLQQRAIEASQDQGDTGADFRLSLVSTSNAVQRFQIRNIELHLSCKFRSSSDLVNDLSDDQPADIYNAGIDGDFLVLHNGSEARSKRTRSSSLNALTQQALANQRQAERSATVVQRPPTIQESAANTQPIAISTDQPPPLPPKPDDLNWIKPGGSRMNLRTHSESQIAPPPGSNYGGHSLGSNRFQIGARPNNAAQASDSPLSSWLGKMATNIMAQFDNTQQRPPSTSYSRSPSRSPTHSPNHSPRPSHTHTNSINPNNNLLDVPNVPPPRPHSPAPPLTPQYPHYHPAPPNYTAPLPPSIGENIIPQHNITNIQANIIADYSPTSTPNTSVSFLSTPSTSTSTTSTIATRSSTNFTSPSYLTSNYPPRTTTPPPIPPKLTESNPNEPKQTESKPTESESNLPESIPTNHTESNPTESTPSNLTESESAPAKMSECDIDNYVNDYINEITVKIQEMNKNSSANNSPLVLTPRIATPDVVINHKDFDESPERPVAPANSNLANAETELIGTVEKVESVVESTQRETEKDKEDNQHPEIEIEQPKLGNDTQITTDEQLEINNQQVEIDNHQLLNNNKEPETYNDIQSNTNNQEYETNTTKHKTNNDQQTRMEDYAEQRGSESITIDNQWRGRVEGKEENEDKEEKESNQEPVLYNKKEVPIMWEPEKEGIKRDNNKERAHEETTSEIVASFEVVEDNV